MDESLGGQIGSALSEQGFDVRVHPNPNLQGHEKRNVCNRGTSGAGVIRQLSLL